MNELKFEHLDVVAGLYEMPRRLLVLMVVPDCQSIFYIISQIEYQWFPYVASSFSTISIPIKYFDAIYINCYFTTKNGLIKLCLLFQSQLQ